MMTVIIKIKIIKLVIENIGNRASNLDPQNYLNLKILKNSQKIKISGPGTLENGFLGPFLPRPNPERPWGGLMLTEIWPRDGVVRPSGRGFPEGSLAFPASWWFPLGF